jgi:arabinofuranan 3-O-arabinosyltransferase
MKGALATWRSQPAWVRHALWPAAVVAYLLKVSVAADAGFSAFDLLPVWQAAHAFINHSDPYAVSDVVPFLYLPSALLLLVPFGALPWFVARGGFFVFEVLALPAAMALCLRAISRPVLAVYGGAALLGLALFEPATSALVLHNFTVVSFVGEALFLFLASRGRWVAAGTVLGFSLALKPLAVLLIVVPLLYRQWRSAAVAVAIPFGLSLLALPFIVGNGFFTRALPFITSPDVGGVWNASLTSLGNHLELPTWIMLLVRIAVLLLALRAAYQLLRRSPDDGVTLAEVAGVLMLAQLLCFSITWTHYGLLLVPWLLTVGEPRSTMRHPLVASGAVLVAMGAATIGSQFGSVYAASLSMTVGLLLMLIGVMASLRRGGSERETVQGREVSSPAS